MKTVVVFAICLSLSLATLNIPLKTQKVTTKINDQEHIVDYVLYKEVNFSYVSTTSATKNISEKVIFDTTTNVNYIISKTTKFNDKEVSNTSFDCTGVCENGVKQTESSTILGGKAILEGGITLAQQSILNFGSSEGLSSVYIPDTVSSKTLAQNVEVLSFANAGVSLGRNNNSLISLLASNKLVNKSKQFSLYVHDTIAQINLGDVQPFFICPGEKQVALPTVDQKSWSVSLNDISFKDTNLFEKGSPAITANFDTTSRYIYVPHVEGKPAEPTKNIPATEPSYYFMNSKSMPCFAPDSNLDNKLSFVCAKDKFPGFSEYSPVIFVFQTENKGENFNAVIQPTDYIKQRADGSYELLFRFATAPQNTNQFYLGTAFFESFYATFNSDQSTVSLAKKFNIDSSSLHIPDEYLIPLIVVGILVTLSSIAILFVILKKVKLDTNTVIEIPMYSKTIQYSPAPQMNYSNQQPVISSSYNPNLNYNPIQTTSVYAPVSNAIVNNPTQLRQSQTQLRQSQNMVLQGQPQYVIKQTF